MAARAGWEDWGKLLLRLAVGGLLLFHGVAKMRNGVGWMAGPLSGLGLPAFVAYGAYVGEVIAPIFVILGKWARIAGLVVAFNMASAITIALRGKVFTLNQGGGWAIELELLFLLGGIIIFLLGSGKYSISKGAGAWD
jgi:putative oxidoreductase